MNLEQIKTAVRSGQTVHVGNTAYCVNLHTFPNGEEQWLIRCVQNDYCIGLTWADGVTMNGKPEDFFVCEPAPVSVSSAPALVLVLRGDELVNVEYGQDEAAVARLAGRLEAGSSLRTVVVPLGLVLRAEGMEKALNACLQSPHEGGNPFVMADRSSEEDALLNTIEKALGLA